jgi:crotonobetainyl-CoA:carnitine CoA-transferase CaiB-like acyl-CoA transferase
MPAVSGREEQPRPLTILEFGLWVAGPYAGRVLASLGADVIKIEAPPDGDYARHYGPPGRAEGALFAYTSTGKSSVCLDLKSDEGQQMALAMAARADVILENLSPGTVDRLGIGYELVKALNPKIVYCSVRGFAGEGVWKDLRAVDGCIQGWAGVAASVGEADGEPFMDRTAPVDSITASYAALAILAAIRHRDLTGVGQHIEVPMMDAAMAADVSLLPVVLADDTGAVPVRTGRMHHSGESAVVRARDRYLVVELAGTGPGSSWQNLLNAIGRGDLADDPSLMRPADRAGHARELLEILDEGLSLFPSAHIAIKHIEAAGGVAQPVLSPGEAARHPHIVARKMIVDPGLQGIPTVAVAAARGLSGGGALMGQPQLGEHDSVAIRRVLDRPWPEPERSARG